MNEHSFSERLKFLRKQKGLTQQQLADLLNVSNKSVSRWESEGGYPDIELLAELAKALIHKEKSEIVAAVFEKYPMNCLNPSREGIREVDALAKKFSEGEAKDIALLEKLISAVRERPGNRGQIYPVVNAAKAYIDAHFCDPTLCIEQVSDHFSYNKKYISTLFKKQMQVGISEYIRTLRLNRAAELLEAGEQSIAEIAYAVGFRDPLYFSKLFKLHTGRSPKKYLSQTR